MCLRDFGGPVWGRAGVRWGGALGEGEKNSLSVEQ